MKIKTMALLSAAAITLAACGQKADTGAKNTENGVIAADPASPAVAAITADQAFVNAAAASDAFEIETSRLAATNAASPGIKKYADQMIAAHTASTANLKAITATLAPALMPDPTLTPEQQSTLDALRGQTGEAFDTAYASGQTTAHEKTLVTLNRYVGSGDIPELRKFAKGLAPTVAAHLNMARALTR